MQDVDSFVPNKAKPSNFSCYSLKNWMKLKNESCVVNIAGDKINILNGGGIDDNITWTVHATDGFANSPDKVCSIKVNKK